LGNKGKRQLEIVNQILELLKEYQAARREGGIKGLSDGFMFQFQKELNQLAEELERRQLSLPDSLCCKLCGQNIFCIPNLPTTIGGVGTMKPGKVSEWYGSRSLSKEGLCRECEDQVAEQIHHKGCLINQYIEDMQGEQERVQQIKLCRLILENAEYLQELEKKSIPTIEPSPSELIQEYREVLQSLESPSS